jgi:hypothetical protein
MGGAAAGDAAAAAAAAAAVALRDAGVLARRVGLTYRPGSAAAAVEASKRGADEGGAAAAPAPPAGRQRQPTAPWGARPGSAGAARPRQAAPRPPPRRAAARSASARPASQMPAPSAPLAGAPSDDGEQQQWLDTQADEAARFPHFHSWTHAHGAAQPPASGDTPGRAAAREPGAADAGAPLAAARVRPGSPSRPCSGGSATSSAAAQHWRGAAEQQQGRPRTSRGRPLKPPLAAHAAPAVPPWLRPRLEAAHGSGAGGDSTQRPGQLCRSDMGASAWSCWTPPGQAANKGPSACASPLPACGAEGLQTRRHAADAALLAAHAAWPGVDEGSEGGGSGGSAPLALWERLPLRGREPMGRAGLQALAVELDAVLAEALQGPEAGSPASSNDPAAAYSAADEVHMAARLPGGPRGCRGWRHCAWQPANGCQTH